MLSNEFMMPRTTPNNPKNEADAEIIAKLATRRFKSP